MSPMAAFYAMLAVLAAVIGFLLYVLATTSKHTDNHD